MLSVQQLLDQKPKGIFSVAPADPVEPVGPGAVELTGALEPTGAVAPVAPGEPLEPVGRSEPLEPVGAGEPEAPLGPEEPSARAGSVPRTYSPRRNASSRATGKRVHRVRGRLGEVIDISFDEGDSRPPDVCIRISS